MQFIFKICTVMQIYIVVLELIFLMFGYKDTIGCCCMTGCTAKRPEASTVEAYSYKRTIKLINQEFIILSN